MARFLVLYRPNLAASGPVDPKRAAEIIEAMLEDGERFMEAGIITDSGFFMDGNSGFFIFEGTSEDVFNLTNAFGPFMQFDVKEIVPFEKGKSTLLDSLRMWVLSIWT